MVDMVQIAAIAVTAIFCGAMVKKSVAEISLVLSMMAGTLLLFLSIEAMGSVLDLMGGLADTAGLSPAILTPVIKSVGISILTRITAELCRDAKEGAIASFVEIAGTVAALWVALPLIQTVLNMIMELL